MNTVNFSSMENIQVRQQKLSCFFKIADHYMSVRAWQMERIQAYSHLIQIWQTLLTVTDETKLAVITMQVTIQSTLSQE